MIDHLSHSQITAFTNCPRKWAYEKIDHAPRERIPTAFAFGIAVHDTLAAVNEAALNGTTIDAVATFNSRWTVADDDLATKGRALVAAYTPPPDIIGVEQPFTVELAPDLPPVEGRIDLIHGDLVVADLKTSATRHIADTANVEAQLGLYNLVYPATEHQAIVLGKLKTPTITVQPIIPWPVDRLRQHYREVHAAMKAGIRFANRSTTMCPTCSFFDRCTAEG